MTKTVMAGLDPAIRGHKPKSLLVAPTRGSWMAASEGGHDEMSWRG